MIMAFNTIESEKYFIVINNENIINRQKKG